MENIYTSRKDSFIESDEELHMIVMHKIPGQGFCIPDGALIAELTGLENGRS